MDTSPIQQYLAKGPSKTVNCSESPELAVRFPPNPERISQRFLECIAGSFHSWRTVRRGLCPSDTVPLPGWHPVGLACPTRATQAPDVPLRLASQKTADAGISSRAPETPGAGVWGNSPFLFSILINSFKEPKALHQICPGQPAPQGEAFPGRCSVKQGARRASLLQCLSRAVA